MKKSRPVARNSLWCLSHATLNVVLFGGAGVAAALSATCGLLRQSVRSALGTGFGVWYGALLRRLRTAIKRAGVEAVGPRVHPGSASVDFELEISDVRSTCASLFLFYEASVLQDDAKVVFRPVGHALGSQGGLTCRLVHPLSLFFNTTSGATLALKRPGGGGAHSLLQTSAVGRLLVEGVSVRRLGAAAATCLPERTLLSVFARLHDCVLFFEGVSTLAPRVPRGLACGGALQVGVKNAWGRFVCLFEIPGRSLAWRVAGVTRRDPTPMQNYNSFHKAYRVCCTNLRYLVQKGLAAFGRPPSSGLLLCCEPAPGLRGLQAFERVGATDNLLQTPLVEAPLILDVIMGCRLLVLTRLDVHSGRPTRGACTLDDLLAARATAPLLSPPPIRTVLWCIDYLYGRLFPGNTPDTSAILAAAQKPLENGLRVQESTAKTAPFLAGADAAHPRRPGASSAHGCCCWRSPAAPEAGSLSWKRRSSATGTAPLWGPHSFFGRRTFAASAEGPCAWCGTFVSRVPFSKSTRAGSSLSGRAWKPFTRASAR